MGLAAAAHLVGRGLEPLVLEAGDAVGAGVREWAHVRVFRPWGFNVDPAAQELLEAAGWRAPDPEGTRPAPSCVEHYLLPLAALPADGPPLRTRTRVLAVTRRATDKMKDAGRDAAPFELLIEGPSGRERVLARAVIDASGSLSEHNPLGSGGVPAVGEPALADRIAYGLPDVLAERDRYAGQTVLVVGAGHSAMNVLQDLVTLRRGSPATRIVWAVRRAPGDDFGGGDDDELPARGALGQVVAHLVGDGEVELATACASRPSRRPRTASSPSTTAGRSAGRPHHRRHRLPARPDHAARGPPRPRPRVEAPVALAPLVDPNIHSCGSVPPHGERELAHPESGFYIAGMKSYGRAPTFLMLTGYEQVRSIAAAIAGDREAADRVELLLPETGVCKAPVVAGVGRLWHDHGDRGAVLHARRRRHRMSSAARTRRRGWTPRRAAVPWATPGPDPVVGRVTGRRAPGGAAAGWRTRAWAIAGALSVTETVSWGVLYYAFAAFLVPMQDGLGFSEAELTGAFSLAMLVAAVAGLAVGRYLDRHSPRALMTLGSVAGAVLVLGWSQVEGLAAFYALWCAIGLVMAVVLYEPAFTVLAKHFPRRRSGAGR